MQPTTNAGGPEQEAQQIRQTPPAAGAILDLRRWNHSAPCISTERKCRRRPVAEGGSEGGGIKRDKEAYQGRWREGERDAMDGLGVAGSCRRSLGVHTRSCAVCLSFIHRGSEARRHVGSGLSRFRLRTGSGLWVCVLLSSGSVGRSHNQGLIKTFYFYTSQNLF